MMTPEIKRLRQRGYDIWARGLAAADPVRAIRISLGRTPLLELAPGGRRLVLGVGKAARGMVGGVLELFEAQGLPSPEALVVTNYENAGELPGAEVLAAGHPVPDENGAKAARSVLERLNGLGARDQLLALISGGGSALLPAPVPGVSLAEKAAVSQLLLASGADINAMNLIRQHLSLIKGGGMARAAAPAQVTALILSDVVGDDLSTIASGPTVARSTTRLEARAALERFALWEKVPASVRAHLVLPDTDEGPAPQVENRLVGSNSTSLCAMVGPDVRPFPRPLVGDVSEAVHLVMAQVLMVRPGEAVAFGGETTVVIKGTGKGGRNQELALRFALLAERRQVRGPWVFLAAGTDGRDGPTEAAGGIIDPGTLTRMRQEGIDPERALENNDSHTALECCGGLVLTGATGTNVADLAVFVRG